MGWAAELGAIIRNHSDRLNNASNTLAEAVRRIDQLENANKLFRDWIDKLETELQLYKGITKNFNERLQKVESLLETQKQLQWLNSEKTWVSADMAQSGQQKTISCKGNTIKSLDDIQTEMEAEKEKWIPLAHILKRDEIRLILKYLEIYDKLLDSFGSGTVVGKEEQDLKDLIRMLKGKLGKQE